jgi:TonB family protein
MGQISKRPDFSREDLEKLAAYLKRNYPPIALRSGIEGRVILELFIDAQGAVRRIEVLREDPEGRGFGEVAKQGFSAIRAVKPARANEAPVAVRYRYPIAFTIK